MKEGERLLNHGRSSQGDSPVFNPAYPAPCPCSQIEPSDWNGSYVVQGGHSILLEEYTTTWCPRCAEIDLDLGIVAEEHGTRIAMVSYHPSDGVDAFGPEAAQHRIERLKIQHTSLGATPSFIVHNGEVREDVVEWPDVQGDILRAESDQRQYTNLTVTAQTNDTHLTRSPSCLHMLLNLTIRHSIRFSLFSTRRWLMKRSKILANFVIEFVGLAEFPMEGQHFAIWGDR